MTRNREVAKTENDTGEAKIYPFPPRHSSPDREGTPVDPTELCEDESYLVANYFSTHLMNTSGSGNPSRGQTRRYLNTLFHDLGENEQINFRPKHVENGFRNFFYDSIEDAVEEWSEPTKVCNVYVAINPRDRNKVDAEKKKGQPGVPGGKITVSRVITLFSDYDYQKMGKSREEALKDLQNLPCPPSMIVDSGGGLQPYWLLTEPVSTEEEKALAERIMSAMCKWWKTDNVKDYSRILRVPGSLNIKYDPPRECFIEQPDTGARYSLDELWQMLPEEFSSSSSTSGGNAGEYDNRTTSSNPLEDDDPIPEGDRSNTLISIGGKICKDRTWEDTKAFITLIDKVRCDPPLQDDDPEAFKKVLQSVRAYWEKDSVHSTNGQGNSTTTGADGNLGSPEWYREIMGEVDLIKILDEGIPEPSYLVDGLIPEGQYIIMFGDEGRGKTWLALIITVICLKQGKRVVYLDFENSRFKILERLRTLGATPEDLEHLNFLQSPSPESWEEAWLRVLTDYEPSLVVGDSMLGILHSMGLGQDSADDLGEFERVLVDPSKQKYGATVLVLDHPTHNEKNRPAGSKRKKTGADTLLRVDEMDGRRVNREYPVGIKITLIKDRECQLPMNVGDYCVYRVGGDPFEQERLSEVYSDKPSPNDERVLAHIQKHSDKGQPDPWNFLKDDLVAKKDPRTKKMPPGKMGESTLTRVLDRLKDQDLIEQDAEGWWIKGAEKGSNSGSNRSPREDWIRRS